MIGYDQEPSHEVETVFQLSGVCLLANPSQGGI